MSAIDLYARATNGFDQRVAQALNLLQHTAAQHPGQVVQATSLGAEDMVVTDLIARHKLPITIATLDTGALHAETVALITTVQRHYSLVVAVYRPQPEAVLHFVKTEGPEAMVRSLALRQACCSMRKLEPLGRMLAGHSAWVTGLRRAQSGARGEVPLSDTDSAGRLKLNPLADWSWADVWHYMRLHQVPYNPLHDQFMPSIGCAPCTRAIAVGEPFRAGRWWWEQNDAKECGLHVKADPPSANRTPSATAPPHVSMMGERA